MKRIESFQTSQFTAIKQTNAEKNSQGAGLESYMPTEDDLDGLFERALLALAHDPDDREAQ